MEGSTQNCWHGEVVCGRWELARGIHSFLLTIVALVARWIARKGRARVGLGRRVFTAIFVWENRWRDAGLGLLDPGRFCFVLFWIILYLLYFIWFILIFFLQVKRELMSFMSRVNIISLGGLGSKGVWDQRLDL